jgi:geranylgeranylglycerol-phosphate geranylgeranyltransferase
MQKFSLKDNIIAYIVSMRWYCAFISGMAGWLSITFSVRTPNIYKELTVLSILFIGWGVNQVINDYLGLTEDKYNAPQRPMVTGKLNIKFALYLSIVLFLIGFIITYMLSKQAIIFYLLIFSLNIVYERAKRMPLLGNIFFGLLIASCLYYAAICTSQQQFTTVLLNSRIAALAILVWLINFVLCFFSDFKDYEGDKKTKVRTLVVLLGLDRAKYLGLILIILPFIYLYFILRFSILRPYLPNLYFFIMLIVCFICFLYPAMLFVRYPQGKNTYYSLEWIIIADVLFKTMLMGLVYPIFSVVLFIINFFLIKILFNLYRDYPI